MGEAAGGGGISRKERKVEVARKCQIEWKSNQEGEEEEEEGES